MKKREESEAEKSKVDVQIVQKQFSLVHCEESLDSTNDDRIHINYDQMLTWWFGLPDVWKRVLMMKSNFDDFLAKDTAITPTKEFITSLLERTHFSSMWKELGTLAPLNTMRNLVFLGLEFIDVDNFDEISGMTSIEVIDATGSDIVSLEGLENFNNLKVLLVTNTNIRSIKPIAALEKLEKLSIRGTLVDAHEVELFKKLHPNTDVSFITPMNPLRIDEDSFENPIFDFFQE